MAFFYVQPRKIHGGDEFLSNILSIDSQKIIFTIFKLYFKNNNE